MSQLKDAFSKLKSTIVGVSSSDIDSKLDGAVRDIVKYKSQSGRNGYIDLVRSLISKTDDFKVSSAQGIFGQGMSPAALGQGQRMIRYKAYEAIVYNINYCFRALSVLTDNILSPDDITKISLEISPKTYLEDEVPTDSKVTLVKEVLGEIGLEKSLGQIVRNTLQFGDYFVEIADSETALTSRSVLVEGYGYISGDLKSSEKENITYNKEDLKVKIVMDYSSFNESSKENEKKKENNVKNIHFLLHEPRRVVKLQSEMFPLCFGYLIFPKRSFAPFLTIEDDAINNICMSILRSLEKKIPQIKELGNDQDLKDILTSMIRSTGTDQLMSIRFVPPNKIEHFNVPSSRYFPYGESIFEASQFTSKVLIALETALAIQRISRSTEKRKISIEVGIPRDAKKSIENMKEAFRKRKVSLDSFGTVDTIPSQMSTFEDIYIPQKDGKPYVDIDTFTAGNVDIRSKVDELKFMRDSVIASLGVPASFLNIEENLSNKCISLDSKIKLLSGKNVILRDLILEFNENGKIENKYTYSYDNKTGKIVPGEIIWAGLTRKKAKVIKITLDNGKSEVVTPDHHFMLRDGTYIEAQYLKSGDSLMPLYYRYSHLKTTKKVPYQEIYHPGIRKWELTHRIVAKFIKIVKDKDRLNVHHSDFNPLNNNPSNLEGLSNQDHLNVHISHKDFITTGRGNIKLENYETCYCKICGEKFVKHIRNNQITCLRPECKKERARIDGLKSGKKSRKRVFVQCPFCGEIFYRSPLYIKNLKSPFMTCGKKECYCQSFKYFSLTPEKINQNIENGRKGGNISKYKLVEYNRIHGAPMKGRTKETHPEIFARRAETILNEKDLNHKVLFIEEIESIIDTGDITVKHFHNFTLSSGIIVSNSALSEENILFARTIVGHQKYFTEQVTSLIQKVFDIVKPEEALDLLDNVSIAFPSPKSLQFEREARYMNELAGLVESLERLGISKEYSKKKYLTQIDWNEVKKYNISDDLDKELGTEEDEGEGGMGGIGGGF